MNTLTSVAAVFVFFGAGTFVLIYSLMAPWWRSQEGVNAMAFTLSVAGFAALRCLTAIFGDGYAGQTVLRAVLMIAIGVTAWHRVVMLLKAQLRNLPAKDVAPRE